MALDEALLDAVAANEAAPTVRLYQWERPAITVGRFQNLARTIDTAACEAQGVPIVRRITGGRGILHGSDLTLSIAAPVEALGFAPNAAVSAIALYERLARGFLCAFAELGIAAAMGTCCRERACETRGDCFAIVSQADILDAKTGRKLLGAAMHRRDRWFLEQMSLPLFPFLPAERAEAQEALCREVFRGSAGNYRPSFVIERERAEVAEILLHGLADTLGGAWERGEATRAEQERAGQLSALRYACPSWTQGTPAAKHLFDR